MKHSNSELTDCIVESMEEAIESYERKLTAMREVKRISDGLQWAEEFSLYGKFSIRKGIGVYFIYHKDVLVYIGTGNVDDRVRTFRDAVKGKNTGHPGGGKANEEDSDISNYSATYVILGNSHEYDGASNYLEYDLIKLYKIRGLAKYNTEKMAGK